MEHTWGSGVPVHFGGIYLGYLASLWLWRRRERLRAEDPAPGPSELSRQAAKALGVGVVIVVVGGALVSLALGEFPGVTWFLVRVLIAVPLLPRSRSGRSGNLAVCDHENSRSLSVVAPSGPLVSQVGR